MEIIIISLILPTITAWKKWKRVASIPIILSIIAVALDNLNEALGSFITDEFIWAVIILSVIGTTFLNFFKPIATKPKEEKS